MAWFAAPSSCSPAAMATKGSNSHPEGRRLRERIAFVRWTALSLALAAGATQAQSLPRWELGLGATSFYLPDYRGADEGRLYTLPVPYFIYRGERVRADREGLRGEIFESERVELNVSAGIGVPVRSDDNEARRGMPSLDPVLQIGPSLNLTLWRSDDRRSDWQLRLPLRAALSFDDAEARDAGVVFAPRLRWSRYGATRAGGATVRVNVGPDFATRRYHAYTHEVATQYATLTRPAYAAQSGYSGFSVSATLDRTLGAHRFFGFLAADAIHGAAYVDSPLVRRKFNANIGIAYVYVFASGRTSPSDD